jgi:rhamnosyltransferase subunit B
MKVLMAAVGSAGDVHPFLAIGRQLQSRGHEVELMTNPFFEDMVKQAGLGFHPLGTVAHYVDAFNSPRLWHPVDGLGVFWRRMARHAVWPTYERIAQSTSSASPHAVIATPVMLGACLAREKLGIPLLSVYTAATNLRSCENPLTIAHLKVPAWIPHFMRTAMWWALDRWKLEPMVSADLNTWRQRLGLPPMTQSTFGDWVHSPDAGVTLFPPWFAAAPGDWPAQVVQAGFPLYDGDAGMGLPDELTAFLDAGDKPVVFTLGTAMQHGREFFDAALRTCAELNLRGIFLSKHAAQIPEALPDNIHYSSYGPFSLLLPRVAALVHHGGIGSSAQALRAAIPQLLTPLSFDQFDNTMRLEQLGVASSITPGDRTFSAMTPRLRDLLNSPAVAAACRAAATRLQQDRALDTVCDQVEKLQ